MSEHVGPSGSDFPKDVGTLPVYFLKSSQSMQVSSDCNIIELLLFTV